MPKIVKHFTVQVFRFETNKALVRAAALFEYSLASLGAVKTVGHSNGTWDNKNPEIMICYDLFQPCWHQCIISVSALITGKSELLSTVETPARRLRRQHESVAQFFVGVERASPPTSMAIQLRRKQHLMKTWIQSNLNTCGTPLPPLPTKHIGFLRMASSYSFCQNDFFGSIFKVL